MEKLDLEDSDISADSEPTSCDNPYPPLESYQIETVDASDIRITNFSEQSRLLLPQVDSEHFQKAFASLYFKPLFDSIIEKQDEWVRELPEFLDFESRVVRIFETDRK